MAHERCYFQESKMRKLTMKQIAVVLRQLTPSQLRTVAAEVEALEIPETDADAGTARLSRTGFYRDPVRLALQVGGVWRGKRSCPPVD